MNKKNESEVKFLLKHSSIYGLGAMLSKLVGFILLPLYTRYLTASDYGTLELIDIVVTMIGMVVGVGLATTMSRFYFVSDELIERQKVISSVLFMVLVTSVVFTAVLMYLTDFIAMLMFNKDQYSEFFKIAFYTLAIGIMIDVALNYLRIQQRSLLFISYSLISMIFNVSLNIYFIVIADMGVAGILYASLLTKVFIGLPVLVWVWLEVRFAVSFSLIKELLKFSMPLIPSQLANSSVGYSDRFFINYFISTAETGIYGLAQKLGTVVHMFVTQPFIMTFLPRRFEIVNRDKNGAPEIFAKIFDMYMLVAVSVSLLVALFSDIVIKVMTTSGFYSAAELIPIIAFTLVIFGMKYHFEFGIHHTKKTYYIMNINIFTAVLHISLNWFLIERFGIWGALYASLMVITINTSLVYWVGSHLYKIPFNLLKAVRLLSLAVVMVVISRSVHYDSLLISGFVQIIFFFSYILMLPVIRVFNKEEMLNLYQIIKKRFFEFIL